MRRRTAPPPGWERALLVALLQSGDVEEIPLGEHRWSQRGYRLSVIVPFSMVPHLELLGADEEDLEEGDHSGAGDEAGMDSDREPDLGATCEFDHVQAWQRALADVEDAEDDQSCPEEAAAGGIYARRVA